MTNKGAVLLTCFNRKEKTLESLSHLFTISNDFDIYLVDDGSTDGTSVAVSDAFPQVEIINGSGDLFWSRGMRLAWNVASKKNYDFYLWLNDDVVLYENSIEELFSCFNASGSNAIISGIVESKDKSEILYGGSDDNGKRINPKGTSQNIKFLNGNIVLVSKEIFNTLGNLDPIFHHDLGDVEYGFRAIKKGIPVLTTRVPIAYGEKNSIRRERQPNSTISRRFKRLYSPLGSNPKINFYFRRKYFGLSNAMAYYGFQHAINIMPDSFVKLIFGKKYI